MHRQYRIRFLQRYFLIIEHNKNGLLVPAGSGAVFAVAIGNLLTDKNKQKALAKELHAHVMEKYSLETMVSKTKEIYTTLLRG